MNSDIKLLYVDIQTTGLDSKKNEIIELSSLLEVNGQIVDAFNCKAQPSNIENLHPDILKILNLSKLDLQVYPARNIFNTKFLEYLNKNLNENDRYILTAYNSRFISDFLYSFLDVYKNNSFQKYFLKYHLDIMEIAKLFFFTGKLNSVDLKFSNVCKSLDIYLKNDTSLDKIKALYKLHKVLDKRISITD